MMLVCLACREARLKEAAQFSSIIEIFNAHIVVTICERKAASVVNATKMSQGFAGYVFR